MNRIVIVVYDEELRETVCVFMEGATVKTTFAIKTVKNEEMTEWVERARLPKA